jgi:hypothetical protein
VATDAIRDLLAGLDDAGFVPRPQGYTVRRRQFAIDAGGDSAELDAWVKEHGGQVKRVNPVQTKGRDSGKTVARTMPGEVVYVFPLSALTGRPPRD